MFSSTLSNVVIALNNAIRKAAAHGGDGKQFSRKSALSLATMLRLLIGAEGGTLNIIIRAAGIKVTASAVSQRRSQIST